MILHYISVTFSHFKKGSKLLQGHARKGSKFLQVCVKGVVFYKVSFYLKRKKKYLPQKWAVSGSLEKNTQLERATEYAAAKKKRDYSTSAWSRYWSRPFCPFLCSLNPYRAFLCSLNPYRALPSLFTVTLLQSLWAAAASSQTQCVSLLPSSPGTAILSACVHFLLPWPFCVPLSPERLRH